ncbi:Protein Jade-1 [Halotydeus destructor]|nr:Protein Jade-1 [Halotydeus destructor]
MSSAKGTFVALGKRGRTKSVSDDDFELKRSKYDSTSDVYVGKSRIYNFGKNKKPAELFRKDLISAMKMADTDHLNPEDYLSITDPWREEWEKGVQVPVNPDSIREARVTDLKCDSTKKSSSTSCPDSPFKMPKNLLRFEPERDLASAKYEIDLTDHCWLLNIKENEPACILSEELFEDIMNELEYQCARNMKEKHVGIEYDDHIICDVCRSPDAEDENEMVFCDSCNMCVHQACYGITEIPDGDWLCKACEEIGVHYQQTLSCVLCPNKGGAFKPTACGKWAHVACALWIPEVSIGCVTAMEPITKIKQIPSSRWSLNCCVCGEKRGAPIQCSIKTCKTAYHVTCAFATRLKMKAIVENNSKGVRLKSFCPRHSDKEGESSGKTLDDSSSQGMNFSNNFDNDKNNRFWMYIDINEVNQCFQNRVQKAHLESSSQAIQVLIDIVLQYWKVKRTSNFGLPLIKVVTADTIEELQKERRRDILRLRINLERIRNLTYMICRREKMKRSWFQAHNELVEKSVRTFTGFGESSEDQEPLLVLSESERTHLMKDIVHSNIIFEDEATNTLAPKKITRELNRLLKVEKAKYSKPNPYARSFAPSRRKNDLEESAGANDELDVTTTSTPKKMPLKNKPVPTNVLETEKKKENIQYSPTKLRLNSKHVTPNKIDLQEDIKTEPRQDSPASTRRRQLDSPTSCPSPRSPKKGHLSPLTDEKRLLRSVMQRSQQICNMEDTLIRKAADSDSELTSSEFHFRRSLIH